MENWMQLQMRIFFVVFSQFSFIENFILNRAKIKLSGDIGKKEGIELKCLEGEANKFLKYKLGNIDSVGIGTNETSDASSDFHGTTPSIDDQITTLASFIENISLDDLTYTPILRDH